MSTTPHFSMAPAERKVQVRADGGVLASGTIGSLGFVCTPKRLIIMHASWGKALQPCDERRIRELHKEGMLISELAQRYDAAPHTIAALVLDQPSSRQLGARDGERTKRGKEPMGRRRFGIYP